MNLKNFLISSLSGFVVYWLLGGLFYATLFPDLYPCSGEKNTMLITLGCLFPSVALGYIINQWTNISTFVSGVQAGAIIGLLNAIGMNCMMYSCKEMNTSNFAKDVLSMTVITALTVGVIALVRGKLSNNS